MCVLAFLGLFSPPAGVEIELCAFVQLFGLVWVYLVFRDGWDGIDGRSDFLGTVFLLFTRQQMCGMAGMESSGMEWMRDG